MQLKHYEVHIFHPHSWNMLDYTKYCEYIRKCGQYLFYTHVFN